MASSRESVFFPTLEKCLNEDYQLLSWKQIHRALSSKSLSRSSDDRLRECLCDKESANILIQCIASSPFPTSQSKSSFETRTSAINVTPSSKGRYDIKQIKEDTLWLSKEIRSDEVTCLRIAVLEYQQRGTVQLLKEPPERFAEATSHNGFASSFSTPKSWTLSRNGAPYQSLSSFHTDAHRRSRLLRLYLEERLYILRVAHLLLCATPTTRTSTIPTKHAKTTTTESQWKIDLCQRIRDSWGISNETQQKKSTWLESAVAALLAKLEALYEGNNSLEDDIIKAEFNIFWCQNLVLEMVQISYILLECIKSTSRIPRSHLISSWFGFMRQCAFFESTDLPFPEITSVYFSSFQANIAVFSLAILKLPLALLALDAISQTPTTAPERTQHAAYILNPDTMLEVGKILLDAAKAGSRNAGLAIFAWSLLQQNLRESANESKETREVSQGQRAADMYATTGTDPSGPESVTRSGLPYSQTRRSSTSSDTSQQMPYLEVALDEITSSSDQDDAIAFQANVAVNEMRIFEMIAILALENSVTFANGSYWRAVAERRAFLFDLIEAAADRIDYDEDFFLAVTTVTSPIQSSWDLIAYFQCDGENSIAARFLQSEALMTKAFKASQYRFPYESLPFLTLCAGLSMCRSQTRDNIPPLKHLLENIPTFTAELPAHAGTLEARDQHDIPCRKLVTGQDMFPGRRLQFPRPNKTRNCLSMNSALSTADHFHLPPETLGTVLSTQGPAVIAWHHSYSVLKYLGKAIQHSVVTKALLEAQTAFHATQAVSETVRILTNLLRSTCDLEGDERLRCIDQQSAQEILDEASDGLGGSDDIIAVILALFEDELYRIRNPVTSEVSAELLNQCIHFLYTVLAIRPGRIWPFLAKSGFLGLTEGESQLSTIINAPEITPTEHSVVEGVVCFFRATVEDSTTYTVSRRLRKSHKTSTRFQTHDYTSAGISNGLVSKIILRLQQVVLGILSTSQNWKAISLDQRAGLQSQICTSLSKVLKYHYEIGEASSDILKSDLSQAASYLLEIFLSDSANMLMVQPLLQSLLDSHSILEDSIDYRIYDILIVQLRATFYLFSTFAHANAYLEVPPSILTKKLFDCFPLLIKAYALHETFRLPVLNLMQSLITLFGGQEKTSISLLSFLGHNTTSHMLELLSRLGAPLEAEEVSIGIWRFFSVAISNQQQWLTTYLLTGEEPRQALRRGESGQTPKGDVPSVLQIAITRLCSLTTLPPDECVCTLEFLLCAADHSTVIVADLQANQELLSQFYKYLTVHTKGTGDSDPQTVRIISLIAGVFAICVHDATTRGDTDFSKKLIPKLGYFMEHGISAPPYNVSLHTRLNENFQDKFSPFQLSDFQWTTMLRHPLGKDYYYSLDATDKTLGFSPAWGGPQGKGFAAEIPKANVNLSLVDAHNDLFHQWSLLVLELSHALEDDVEFHKSLIKVLRECLSTDSLANLPEPISTQVNESRSRLGLALQQRVLRDSHPTAESRELLKPAWEAARRFVSENGRHIAISRAESAPILLRSLLYALQPHTQSPSKVDLGKSVSGRSSATSEPAKIALEILDVIVAQGFRAVTTALHDDPTKVLPSDFMILTAILQAALAVPGVDQHPIQLTSRFTDELTIRYACTLLSWSDRLQIDNDPVYGEISIQFLLILSAMPSLAESLAVEGVLTQIAMTNLTKYFTLPGGKGALDEPIRMHAIWSRGILPLVLNLLQLVGAAIAGEVVGFLNEYRNQMNRGSTTSRRPKASGGRTSMTASTWTLNEAAELQSLALIAMIIDTYRDAGASAGIVPSGVGILAWDRAEAREEIEYWLRSRNSLRESIQPMTEQEADWATQKARSSASGAETRLEEMIVEELNAALGFLGGEG